MQLYKDFIFDEDVVIEALEKSIDELKKAKLDHPGPPTKDELPTRPFGTFIEPTFEQIIGRRAENFSENELKTNERVLMISNSSRKATDDTCIAGCYTFHL